MLDAYKKKSRNAKLLCTESYIKSQFNGTVDWLKTAENKEEMIKYASRTCKKRKATFKNMTVDTKKQILETLKSKQDQKGNRESAGMKRLVKKVFEGK